MMNPDPLPFLTPAGPGDDATIEEWRDFACRVLACLGKDDIRAIFPQIAFALNKRAQAIGKVKREFLYDPPADCADQFSVYTHSHYIGTLRLAYNDVEPQRHVKVNDEAVAIARDQNGRVAILDGHGSKFLIPCINSEEIRLLDASVGTFLANKFPKGTHKATIIKYLRSDAFRALNGGSF